MTDNNLYPTSKAQVLALANLISNQVNVVLAEYAATGEDLPSLDSTTTGPFDLPESFTPRLAVAIQAIEAACSQLMATVSSPAQSIAGKAFAFVEPTCLQVVSEAKIADLLLDKPEGVHVDQLAKQCQINSGKLGRILRLLATKHCFREVQPNVFANNRLSMKLVSTEPVANLVGHLNDESAKASILLPTVLKDSYIPSKNSEMTAFEYVHGSPFFQYYRTPEGSKRVDRFNLGMTGWGQVSGGNTLTKCKMYPWATLPPDTTICDVGGGNGHITLSLLRSFPKLKVVLQDLAPAIKQGQEYWEQEHPRAVQNQRVKFIPFDFFQDTPVADCDLYYIRYVLHNWGDEDCVKILKGIRRVIKPHAKLLVHELVLQHLARDPTREAAFQQAPEPLLPNYGAARYRLYALDIDMMIDFNTKERTLEEYISVAEEAGFEFVKVRESGDASLIEFIPV